MQLYLQNLEGIVHLKRLFYPFITPHFEDSGFGDIF